MNKKVKEIEKRINLAKEYPEGLSFLIYAKDDIEYLLSLLSEKEKEIEELKQKQR
jgi:hypothetical protein